MSNVQTYVQNTFNITFLYDLADSVTGHDEFGINLILISIERTKEL